MLHEYSSYCHNYNIVVVTIVQMELYYIDTGGWELCKVFEVISFLA